MSGGTTTLATRSGRPVLAATVATLSVVASLLTAGSVQAAGEVSEQRLELASDPGWLSDAYNASELGQAFAGEWTPSADSRTASASLPGGVGSVSVAVPSSDLVMASRSQQMVRALDTSVAYIHYKDLLSTNSSDNPATVDCLAEIPRPPAQQPSAGYLKTCGEREITVTFDRPTVDPILWLSLGWFYPIYIPPDPTAACYMTWLNAEVVRVDGGAAGARQLDHVSSAQNLAVASNGAVTLDGIGTGLSPTSCEPIGLDTPRGYPAIQVSGLVSSVTISLDHVVQISRLNTLTGEIPRGTVGQPPLALTTSAEVVDLGVSTSAPAAVAPGGTFEWTLEATNLGPAASHGFIVADAVPEAVTGVSLVDAPDGCVLDGRDLSCAVAPPGWTVSQDAVMPTLANLSGGDPSAVGAVLGAGESFGPITLRGTAPVTPGTEIVTTASVSGVDSDLDLTNNSAQTLTTVDAPAWSVAKTVTSSGDTTYPAPGDTLTYTVTATSTTGDVADVVLTDDLTDVLADADLVPGSIRYTVGTAPAEQVPEPGPGNRVIVTRPTTIPAGSTATLTYDVVVHEGAWSTELVNTVTGAGSGAPATCAEGASVLDPSCSTSTTTTARLEVLKQGQVNGVLTGIDGAAFEVVADDSGEPGPALTDLTVEPVAELRGAFEIAGIDPGTYWLRETAAPAGHELLAEPVRFEVATDGSVSVLAGGSDQVVATGGTLTVTDTPSFQLPETGSTGRAPLAVTGAVLLAAAALGLRGLRPRALHTHPPVVQSRRRPGS